MNIKQIKSIKDFKDTVTRTLTDARVVQDNDTLQQLSDSMSGLTTKVNNIDQGVKGIGFTPFLDKGEDAINWLRDFENSADFKGYSSAKQLKIVKNSP